MARLRVGDVTKLLGTLSKPQLLDYSPQREWRVVRDKNDLYALQREFKFKSFEDTWAFLSKVSMRSHLWGHHPKITTSYNVVLLELTTHDVGGLTERDFEMAERFGKFATTLGEKK